MKRFRLGVGTIIWIVMVVAIGVFAVVTLLNPGIGAVGKTCTLADCSDGFVVSLEGNVPDKFTADVRGSDGTHFTTNCHLEPDQGMQGEGCGSRSLNIAGVWPSEVTVSITWEGGSQTRTFRQTFHTYEPNGPGCAGTCQRGETLTMTLP